MSVTITVKWIAKNDDQVWELDCAMREAFTAALDITVDESSVELELEYIPNGMTVAEIKQMIREEIRQVKNA